MSGKFESVYSSKVRAGKRRTYFFDVRKTRGEDFYVTLTESTKKHNSDGYERHKIFLYKEDFNRFLESLTDVVDHVKTELMPDYDYDEFTRRHEEYQAQLAAEKELEESKPQDSTADSSTESEADSSTESEADSSTESDDEISW